MKTKIKAAVISLFLLVSMTSMAHPGGHGLKKEDIKKWTIKGEKTVYGSFLTLRGNNVYLEDEHGKISHINLIDFSEKDQLFIQKRVEKIKALNSYSSNHHSHSKKETSHILIWILAAIIAIMAVLFLSKKKWVKYVSGSITLLFILYSCSKNENLSPDHILSEIAKAYDIDFLRKTFSSFSNVSYVDSDEKYFYVESNGIPDHPMMVGITAWIERVPTPFRYQYSDNDRDNMAWAIPLIPEYEEENNIEIINELQRGAIAISANGIPVFNPYNASGELSWEIGELDAYGGHSGNGDDYHYHYPPVHLASKTNGYPIAFVLDGFPLYGFTEPDGSQVTNLDEHFGHEDENGYYHYHASQTAPYMTPSLRGVVTVDQEGIQHNQIEPQPVASTVRGLKDIVLVGGTDSHEITGLEMNNSNNGYKLSYRTTTNNIAKDGTIDYSWDDSGLFTFTFTTDITKPSNTSSFTYQGNPGEIHPGAYGYH